MRLSALAVGAILILLSGCDSGPQQNGAAPSTTTAPDAPGGPFDYRYAYRLPAGRIRSVQESHAAGCDRLGSARCRIIAIRYNGDDQQATLTLKIDPMLARAYGKAAAGTVEASGGAVANADVAGADSVAAAGRSDSAIAQLRESLGNAQAQLRDPALTPDQRAQASAKVERLQGAIETIGEVDQGAGTSVATTPVILTYTAGTALNGDATFSNAGATFMASLAGLAVVLAGVGPWALLLIGGALLLRRIVQSGERAEAPELPPAPRDHAESRNVVQRWFNRDEHHEHEHVD